MTTRVAKEATVAEDEHRGRRSVFALMPSVAGEFVRSSKVSSFVI